MPLAPISTEDMDYVFAQCQAFLPQFKDARIFITGGTGFVGKWLVESLLYANAQKKLGVQLVVLTRDVERTRKQMPHWVASGAVTLHQGDIRDFVFPEGTFTHVIHGAVDVAKPAHWFDTYQVIVDGTKRVLDLCKQRGARDVLLLSSGAVYGRQDPLMSHVSEQHKVSLETIVPETAYGQGKRIAEWLASKYNVEYGLQCRIARCFAFIGAYLPLDGGFAAGNFIANAVQGKNIEIKSDGSAVRSYQYAAEMALWLLTILMQGEPGMAYNVGSDEEITIRQLADHTAKLVSPPLDVNVLQAPSGAPAERYVPSVKLAQEKLGLKNTISLDEGLKRMFDWGQRSS